MKILKNLTRLVIDRNVENHRQLGIYISYVHFFDTTKEREYI